MEAKLLDIVRGPKDLIVNRLQKELPDLMSNEDFYCMVSNCILIYDDIAKLEVVLILSGFLPGLDQLNLHDKLKHYNIIPKDFRKTLSYSIYEGLNPQNIDEIISSNRVGMLVQVGFDTKDYDLIRNVMNLSYKKYGNTRRITPYVFCNINDDNYMELLEFIYTLSVDNEDTINEFICNTQKESAYGIHHDKEKLEYVIKFIRVLKNITLPEVFDYYMTLRHSGTKPSMIVYDLLNELGVSIKHMVEWSKLHSNSFLEEFLIRERHKKISNYCCTTIMK